MSTRAARKILAVVTSHDAYDNSDEHTGLWLGELTHFWEIVSEAGFDISIVSPKGGGVPLDERSLGVSGGARKANRAFQADERLGPKLEDSLRPDEVDPADYDAIYFAGGHGAMWDFRDAPELARLAEGIDRQGGVVSAVCHGVAGLLDLKRPDGSGMIDGQPVTGYANVEERVIRKTGNVPYLLQDEIVEHGGRYSSGRLPFAPHVVVGDRLVTGQNPFSTKKLARALVQQLRAHERT